MTAATNRPGRFGDCPWTDEERARRQKWLERARARGRQSVTMADAPPKKLSKQVKLFRDGADKQAWVQQCIDEALGRT